MNLVKAERVKFINWLMARARRYMKDYARKNKLIPDVESDDEDILEAIMQTVDAYETEPPPLYKNTTPETFPSMELMMDGISMRLLRSESFLRARNELPYNDGSLQVNDDAKMDKYMAMVDRIEQKFWTRLKALKKSINVRESYRGSSSPYRNLYNLYRYYSEL